MAVECTRRGRVTGRRHQHNPTDPLLIFEPQDQESGEFYEVQVRRSYEGFWSSKFVKGSVGNLASR